MANYRFKLKGVSTGKGIQWNSGYDEIWSIQLQALAGREIEITIGPKVRENSRPQQKYYRGMVVPMIAVQIGETVQNTHEILQYKFFTETDDKGFTRVRSTKLGEWATVEWEEKMTEIRQWAQDFLSLSIPLPNEVDFV